MTVVFAICVADRTDLFAFLYFARAFCDLLQVPVECLNAFTIGQFVFDDHDITPTRPGVGGKSDPAVGCRVNRLSAVRISAGVFVPVLAEVVIGSKIQCVVPTVLVTSLSDAFSFADRISKTIRDR